MLMSGYALASAPISCLVNFFVGSYQGMKLIGPSASLPNALESDGNFEHGTIAKAKATGTEAIMVVSRANDAILASSRARP
jgi:hypothetical protein